jgi:SAM-dependent methyltransferase
MLLLSDPEPFDWYQRYDGIKKFLALEYLEGSLHQSSDLSPLANDGCSPFPHLVDSKKLTRFPSKESCRVLIIGCGTSRLGEDMLMDGWNGGIYQIDYSAVVIKHMTARYDDNFYKKIEASMDYRNSDSEKSEVSHDSVKVKDHEMTKNMRFQCLDITKTLPFENSFFDLIICKGSTFSFTKRASNILFSCSHATLFICSECSTRFNSLQ